MRFSSRLACILAALAVAACQPLPRPFMPEADFKGPKTVAPLVDGGGIVVPAVDNVPQEVSAALQRAMIDALAAQNIPAATSGGNVRSRFLNGAATVTPAGKRMDVAVTWALADRAGKKLGAETAWMTVPRTAWRRPDHRMLAPLAAPAAPKLAALMQEPPPSQAPGPQGIPLHVWPVAGASGDGGAALRSAMESALGRRGYRVTATLAENGLVIAGSVALGEIADGRRPIAVEWAVLDGSGKELGKLDQNNAIPADALADGWDELAPLIAESAAGGIGALLNRLPPRSGTAGG